MNCTLNYTSRHQKAKCVNTSLKVFHLFVFSQVWFFIHFWAVVYAQNIQKWIFDFAGFCGQKAIMADMVKLGYGCINGFITQKLLNSAEGCIFRKCRHLLGLNFTISDWVLWWCSLLVFVGWKLKMWFFGFLCQNVLHAAQQNCTKFQNNYCSKGGRYWR